MEQPTTQISLKCVDYDGLFFISIVFCVILSFGNFNSSLQTPKTQFSISQYKTNYDMISAWGWKTSYDFFSIFHSSVYYHYTEEIKDFSHLLHVAHSQKLKLHNIDDILYKVLNIYGYFYSARGVVVNLNGAIIINDVFYRCKWQDFMPPELTNGKVEKRLPYAIMFLVCHMRGPMWGHWVYDFFAPLVLLPDYLRLHIPIVVYQIMPQILQMLDLLKTPRSNLVYLQGDKNYFYIDQMWGIINPKDGNRFVGEPLRTTIKFFREKLNLSNERPTRLLFKNRFKGERRHIDNWDEIYRIACELYPKYHFENDDRQQQDFDLLPTARFYNSILLLVCPTGSNGINCIFMQNNCVLLIFMASFFDQPLLCGIVTNKDHAVVMEESFHDHWRPQHWEFNINLYKEGLTIAMDIIKNIYPIS